MQILKPLLILCTVLVASNWAFGNNAELWQAAKAGSGEQVRRILELDEEIDFFWRPSPTDKSIAQLLRAANLDHLMKNRNAPVFDEDHFMRFPEEYFFVGPSSIPGNPGFGIYLRKELPKGLKSIPAGTRLPHPYPGRAIDSAEYDALNTRLFELSNKYEDDLNVPFSHPELQRDLQQLTDKYGITISLAEQNEGAAATMIDWDAVYDRFVAYVFEIRGEGEKLTTLYWPDYLHPGDIVFNYKLISNMTLIVNEPPPNDFINLYTLTLQDNSVSLWTEEDRKAAKLHFVTTREIEAGEELFLPYGPLYSPARERSGYRINMSRINGCGRYEYVDTYLKGIKTEKQYLAARDLTRQIRSAEERRSLAPYFKSIVDYVQDETVKIAEISEQTRAWLTEKLGPEHVAGYNRIRDLLNPVEVTRHDFMDYWSRYIGGEVSSDEERSSHQKMLNYASNKKNQ